MKFEEPTTEMSTPGLELGEVEGEVREIQRPFAWYVQPPAFPTVPLRHSFNVTSWPRPAFAARSRKRRESKV